MLPVRADTLVTYRKYCSCAKLGSVIIRTVISPNPQKHILGDSVSSLWV